MFIFLRSLLTLTIIVRSLVPSPDLAQVSLIIVQCQAGLSRSVAVASALSKIINYTDDGIYTKGIPNMFVYTTILDTFFSNPNWLGEYPKISYKRTQSMSQYLTPATVRLNAVKERKRLDG